ncbi:MAG: hypothetical protein GYA21_00390 [Myxococcales bacterium]|nr:hypothetical protein [Myxococcales bacterium]
MSSRIRSLVVSLPLVAVASGCAAMKPMHAEMAPLALSPAATPLERDHFKRDTAGSISEEDLRRVLAAPVFLEEGARVGVIPVATGYGPDPDLPLNAVPEAIAGALERSGLFDGVSEVSTGWPCDAGVSGLRELAARYRADYLVLYRNRFVDRSSLNAWGFSYLALLPLLFAPASTLSAAGVLEATLFDVKTGTILFSVFARVEGKRKAALVSRAEERRALKAELLRSASENLSAQVVEKARRLAAVRPTSALKDAQAAATSAAAP